jgi:hypothetical protein
MGVGVVFSAYAVAALGCVGSFATLAERVAETNRRRRKPVWNPYLQKLEEL